MAIQKIFGTIAAQEFVSKVKEKYQTKIIFNTAYNAASNKAATMSDIGDAIGKLKISIPAISKVGTTSSTSSVYTGSNQSITWNNAYDSNTMIPSDTTQSANVGNFTAYMSIKNPTEYKWSDDTSNTKSYQWSITKKSLTPSLATTSYTYDGGNKTPSVTFSGLAGSENLILDTDYSISYSNNKNAGTATATISLKSTTKANNYSLSKTSLTFTIAKKSITQPTVSSPTNNTYTGSPLNAVISGGTGDTWYTTGGETSATNAGTHTVTFTLKDTNNTQWASGSTGSGTWSIAKKSVTVPTLTSSSGSLTNTWNGSTITVTVNNPDSSLVKTTQDATKSSSNVGSWTFKWDLNDSTNTQWADGGTGQKTATWSINRASVGAKPTTSKTVKWTGSEQTNGYTKPNYVNMTGSDRGTEVNTSGYSATYTPDSNHCWSDNTYSGVTVKLIINKADGVLTLNGTAGNASLGTINSGGSSTVTVASHDNSKVTFTTSASTDYLKLSYPSDNSTVTLTHGGNTGSSNRDVSVTVTCAEDNHHASISRTISATMAKTSSCVAADTLIMMGDGSEKMIKDVKRGESIMTYNMNTGKFEPQVATILWDEHNIVSPVSLHLTFDDGTLIRIIWEHGFFDKTLNTYSYINYNNYNDFIGHDFVAYDKDGYRLVKLVKAEIVEAPVEQYSMESSYNDNFITNGLISMTQEPAVGRFEYFKFSDNVTWDQEDKQAMIDKYGLYTYDEWKEYIPDEEMFNAVNGPYFKILMGKGVITMDDIWYMLQELEDGTK